MTITSIAIVSILISGSIYLFVSYRIHGRSSRLDDQLPMTTGQRQARVRNSSEFSAATVAATISLATVILAYAELAGSMGTWLFWTVITTAAGIFVVRLAAPLIWRKLASRGALRPTLHEFLGSSYTSRILMKGAAVCTSLGFIGALAVELTVGSKFLTGLAPEVPAWAALLLLCGIGVGYTLLGGFRAVVITDRIQMIAIWMSIAALTLLIGYRLTLMGGIHAVTEHVPKTVYDFSWRDGLGSFLVGIAVINIPTFLGDMSIWQRIAASTDETTVKAGLRGSIFSAMASWGALAAIACLLVAVTVPKAGQNPLLNFLLLEASVDKPLIYALLLIVLTGLYGASLSTASTQLIAAGHALHTDLLRSSHDRTTMADSKIELSYSRIILGVSAGVAVIIVEGLTAFGFSIADLVFAVYGSQLGLVPVVIAALTLPPERLGRLGPVATCAVLSGFAGGWLSAAYGKFFGNDNLVFLAPVVSLIFSMIVLGSGLMLVERFYRKSPRKL
ncbi:hypothetical protein [Caballeronia sp. GACF4]|uniref:sodium:solute symporter family transporter n=1 Tax=Caballeronia sp. GACF4 TaxID=2921763 RepID=UPI0020285ECC|nr:hypothetical protein [Caballeronia sp. GACF4]